MRQLILLRGAMGCGKSSWISENNLKQYTLCPDEIRLMVQSPVQTLDGSFIITQKNDNQVWEILFELLEKRMSRGELTIIDATHTRTTLISKYKKLIDKYRYRTYIVDFTDIPIEVCKERNRSRDEYKRVPEDAIDLAYSRFETMSPPNWCKIIKPENFHKEMIWRTENFSSYEKIIHIGDVHGCYAPLKEYFDNNPFNEKYYYIFVGDYIDRGIQNVDVIKFMLSICKNKNVSMLTGNHECVSKDTEILTTNGFVNIKEITKDDFVAQFDIASREITYDHPEELVHKYSEKIIEIRSDIICQKVSPKHEIIYDNKKIRADELLDKNIFQNNFITSGNINNKGIDLEDDWIRLLTWVVCDSSVVDYSKYNKNSKKIRISFHLSKIRKIDELITLLERMNIPFTHSEVEKTGLNRLQPHSINIYGDFGRMIFGLLLKKKEFPKYFKLFNSHQLEIFLDTISKTDGHRTWNRLNFTATNFNDAELIQELCIINNITCWSKTNMKGSGFENGKPQKILTIYNNSVKMNRKCNIEKIDYNDNVYCVQMPKGTIITRTEGKVVFTGNCWLWRWACDQYDLIRSKEFIYNTMPELDSSDIDKADVRELYRKMQQIVLYDYETNNGKINVLVNHAGISNIPDNLIYMSINSFVNGIGKYSDDIDDYWLNNTKDKNPNSYQIRGHRNILNLSIQPNERSFCLEGKVEFGKYLRIVELSKEGFKTVEVKNNIYNVNLRDKSINTNINNEALDKSNSLEFLRNNNYINEKDLGDDISAFNFKRDVFTDRKWNDLTIRARGLFVDTSSGEIVARSYNKFFNVGEYKISSVRMENLKNNLVFPVSAYIKENGFLGLLSYNKKKDELFYASKTTNSGPYRDLFKDILNSYNNFDEDEIKKYLKENDSTLIFEALDPINDPHIMDSKRRNAILLDVVKNDYVFQKIPYNDLLFFGAFYGIPVKTFAFNLESYDEFEELINNMGNYNYKLNGSRIEGFVFEDSIGYMTKSKTGYYNFWKSMRSLKESYVKGRTINLAGLHTAHSNYFYGWLKTKDKEYIHSVGIPELRRKYLEESGISDD